STVHVDENTEFDSAPSTLSQLVGQVVNVQGLQASNGSIQAANVKGNAKNPSIDFRAAIDSIAAPDLIAGGKTLHTTAATRIKVLGRDATFANLAVGQVGRFKGTVLADGSVLAENIETTAAAKPPPPPPPPPAPPVANAGAAQTVSSGAAVNLDGSASADATGIALNFQWTQTAGPIVTLSSASSTTPSFTAPTVPFGQPAAVLTFSLVVSDANTSSPAATVNVTVSPEPPPNPAPVANAGPDQAVASNSAVTLDGSASFDPDAEAISFAWSQSSGAAVTLAGANTAHPTFGAPVVPASSPAATLVFSLVVSDAHASSAAASVTITVNPQAQNFPRPPGTPPPADPNQVIQPLGGNGSHRFELGSQQGLYLQDPTPGEPSVRGFVVVTLGSPASGTGFLPPADTVVTMNGVPLLRDPALNGSFFRLDPAGPQPTIGTGGQMVLVATGTDPQTGKQIQRSLVLPCPNDIAVSSTPAIGSSLAGATSVTITSPSDIT